MRHPQLHHRRAVLLVEPQQRQRQPVFIVQISLRLQYAEPRAQQRRQNFFCGGLPHGAGHRPDDPAGFRCRRQISHARDASR